MGAVWHESTASVRARFMVPASTKTDRRVDQESLTCSGSKEFTNSMHRLDGWSAGLYPEGIKRTDIHKLHASDYAAMCLHSTRWDVFARTQQVTLLSKKTM